MSFIVCMELISRSEEYIKSKVGSKPDYISVNDSYERFELKGGFSNRNDVSFIISYGSELYDIYKDCFKSVREKVKLSKGCSIQRYSLSSYTQTESNLLDEWDFYTSEDVELRVDLYIKADFSLIDTGRLYENLIEEIYLQNGVEVTRQDILNFQALFSDMKQLNLQTLRGELYTKCPHLFYENISSRDEFIENGGSDRKVSETEYKVDFIFRTDCDESCLSEVFESELRSVVQDSVYISEETYMIEGESICVGDHLYDTEDDCVFFYIKVPVTEQGVFTVF